MEPVLWLILLAGCGNEKGSTTTMQDDCEPTDSTEVPFDGVDNDCDPGTPDDDLDGDGHPADSDCDDGQASINPSAAEVPYDGIDNDCDPATDDDDLDGDGFALGADCDDEDAAINPAATETPFDGLDNDCEPETLDDDADGDGIGVTDDCDDAEPSRWATGTVSEIYASYQVLDYCEGYCERNVTGSVVLGEHNPGNGGPTREYLNLPDLSCIHEVGDDLAIAYTTGLSSLQAFSGLVSVGGDVAIASNDDLETLEGLEALEYVGGSLVIGGCEGQWTGENESLHQAGPFGSLRYIGGDLLISGHAALTEVVGLGNLSEIGGSLYVPYYTGSGVADCGDWRPGQFSNLTNFESMGSLARVGGDLVFYRTDGLATLPITPTLTEIGGSLVAYGIASLAGLEGLVEIPGDLLASQLSTGDLDGITRVGGNADISFTTDGGLGSLVSVGGDLYFADGPETFSGLQSLEEVGGRFVLESYSDTVTFHGPPLLVTLPGGLYVLDADALESVDGFEALTSVGDLEINSNNVLSDLSGLRGITSATGDVIIASNLLLADTSDLSSLATVDGSLSIGCYPLMPCYTGGPNPVMTSLAGLESMSTIGGGLYIYDNGALLDVWPLAGLALVGADLVIAENDSLPSADAEALLDAIESVGGAVLIEGNGP